MELSGYRCWDPKRVFTVMNPDAEHVSDEQFLAVHTDYPLTLVNPNLANRGSAGDQRFPMTSAEFLARFLDPNRHHVQAVVMGGSGSGKSHFIKWLSLNIPRRPDQRLLVIPKAGMSLRKIVERLIAELPVEKQGRYLGRLADIGYETADRVQMRKKLCTRIAEALETAQAENEMEGYLVQALPNLFYDPKLREILNSRQGVIEDLVDHIFAGPAGYQRLESQRLFVQADLPLQPKEIGQLSAPTQMLVRAMQGDDDMVQSALLLINRNLSQAISQCLNFTGDQLIELMLDVRRGLKAEGQSLILLIEDFARLQGIDGALLQALIEAASAENGLCDLRWAMAVTRGYYEQQVPAGVQTRMHFVVDMDVPTTADGVTTEKVVAFASRYLNAVRVSGGELVAWRQAHLAGGPSVPPPNRCTDCPHKTVCHNTFGHVDGFGLYPFSGNAVLNMTRRMDAKFEERFNPRVVVKDVMGELLGTFGDEIEAGEFPSKALLQRMGGSKLSPIVTQKLLTENPAQADRRLALLSLWSRLPDRLEALPAALYEAFRLTPPGGLDIGYSDDVDVNSPPTDPGKPTPKSANDLLIEAVQAWGRGGSLQDQHATTMRATLRKALNAYVDWDQIGILPSAVEFEPGAIGFVGQMTRLPSAKRPKLIIPIDAASEDERRQAAMAIEGLIRYGEKRNWDFKDGAILLAAYAEAMERWSAHLAAQVTELPGGTDWDPVAAAVELLTIANALIGLPPTKDAPLVDWVDALFHSGRAADESLVPEWRSLAAELQASRPLLQAIMRTRITGSKGGARSVFIDPTDLCEIIRRVRQEWQAIEEVPLDEVDGRPNLKGLAPARKRVDKDLAVAVQREIARRRDLLSSVSGALPEGYTWKALVGDLRALIEKVGEVGINHSNNLRASLEALLPNAEKWAVEDALKEVAGLDEKDRTNLAILARSKTSTFLMQANGVVLAAERFLEDLKAGIAKNEAMLVDAGDMLDRSKESIARSFNALENELTELGGDHNA